MPQTNRQVFLRCIVNPTMHVRQGGGPSCLAVQRASQLDPAAPPPPRFVRWDSGPPLRCDLLIRSPVRTFAHDASWGYTLNVGYVLPVMCVLAKAPLGFPFAYPRGLHKFQNQGCERSPRPIARGRGAVRSDLRAVLWELDPTVIQGMAKSAYPEPN